MHFRLVMRHLGRHSIHRRRPELSDEAGWSLLLPSRISLNATSRATVCVAELLVVAVHEWEPAPGGLVSVIDHRRGDDRVGS